MKKEEALKLFTLMAESQRQLRNKKLSVEDFDNLMCGFITGLSISMEDKEELYGILRYIVDSDFAKSIGVTGTEVEDFKEVEL